MYETERINVKIRESAIATFQGKYNFFNIFCGLEEYFFQYELWNKFQMADKVQSKLRILELIRDNRRTLFGAFSADLTKIDKSEAWEEILDEAKKLGLIAANKDINYIRDVHWQNLRKRTMKKIDDSKVTGAAGGKEAQSDDIDHLVMDIIGRWILQLQLKSVFVVASLYSFHTPLLLWILHATEQRQWTWSKTVNFSAESFEKVDSHVEYF